jgi:hypothetical protein
MSPIKLEDGGFLTQGPGRQRVIDEGKPGAQPFMAFGLQSPTRLEAFRQHVVGLGIQPIVSPTCVFANDSFAVRDPDETLE